MSSAELPPPVQASIPATGHSHDASPSPSSKETAAVGRRTALQRLGDNVDPSYGYVPLLLYCMVSGMCDSVAFNASGVFVSMQTGNTIFLALGASHLPAGQPRLWLKALVSIACFQAGCFVFGQTRHVGKQRKVVLFVSCMVQALLVVVAAGLAQGQVVPAFGDSRLETAHTIDMDPVRAAQENDWIVLLPIALLAFQFGGQIFTSRVLGFSEIPTNVLTSLYCDLLSDPKLFAGPPVRGNPKRTRRISAAVLTLVGGIVGGWLQRSRAGMSGALWIAAGLKLVLGLAWLVWPTEAPKAS